MRARSVAAVTAQMNFHGIRGAGNRTDAGTDLAQVHLRVTVQSEKHAEYP